MRPIPQPLRHALIRLRPGAWASVLADNPGWPHDILLADWSERGRPLVARRRGAGDRPGCLAAALSLPPSSPVRRVALAVSAEAVARVEPAPPLAAVLAAAPAAWHATFAALLALGGAVAGEPRVFGSFAWQALTGLSYVTATSDLDLLWPLTPELDLPALLDGLAHLQRGAPGRIDGELVHAATGAGVQWQEWAGAAEDVLAKGTDGVALQPRARFLAGLPATG